MALAGFAGGGERGFRIIEKAAHVVVQRSLVSLERQHVVATLVDHLLGDLALTVHGIGGDGSAR